MRRLSEEGQAGGCCAFRARVMSSRYCWSWSSSTWMLVTGTFGSARQRSRERIVQRTSVSALSPLPLPWDTGSPAEPARRTGKAGSGIHCAQRSECERCGLWD